MLRGRKCYLTAASQSLDNYKWVKLIYRLFFKYSFCSASPSRRACYSIPKTKYPILFYEGQHIKCLKMSEDSSRYLCHYHIINPHPKCVNNLTIQEVSDCSYDAFLHLPRL